MHDEALGMVARQDESSKDGCEGSSESARVREPFFGLGEGRGGLDEGWYNTPLPEYVLSCVFRFRSYFSIYFLYLFCIINYLYNRFALDPELWTRSQP